MSNIEKKLSNKKTIKCVNNAIKCVDVIIDYVLCDYDGFDDVYNSQYYVKLLMNEFIGSLCERVEIFDDKHNCINENFNNTYEIENGKIFIKYHNERLRNYTHFLKMYFVYNENDEFVSLSQHLHNVYKIKFNIKIDYVLFDLIVNEQLNNVNDDFIKNVFNYLQNSK